MEKRLLELLVVSVAMCSGDADQCAGGSNPLLVVLLSVLNDRSWRHRSQAIVNDST